MLLNKLSSFTSVLRGLVYNSSKNFAKFPSKKEARFFKARKWTSPFLEDDLYFPHENSALNGGAKRLADHFKKNPDINLFPMNMAFLLYNMAKAEIHDSAVYEEIERHIHKFKDGYDRRFAFGCLYALYKSNSGSTYAISFFESEVARQKDELWDSEVYELLIAASLNKQVEKESLHNFITENLKEKILEYWGTYFRHSPVRLLAVFNAYTDLEYYDQELWDPLLESLKTKRGITKLQHYINYYEKLSDLQSSGKFYKDLAGDIQRWEENLRKVTDFAWRYNIDERRFYTYEELKANREDYKFPNQIQTHKFIEKADKDALSDMTEEEKKAVISEKERTDREKELNEIVMEKFMQLKKGDIVTGLEDLEEDEAVDVVEDYMDDEDEVLSEDISADTKKEEEKVLKQKLRQEKAIRKQMLKSGKAQSIQMQINYFLCKNMPFKQQNKSKKMRALMCFRLTYFF